MISSIAKNTKENKETLEDRLLHFLNFIGAFGDSSSNDNNLSKHEKGSDTHENYRNRITSAIGNSMKYNHCKWPGTRERKIIFAKHFKNMDFVAD